MFRSPSQQQSGRFHRRLGNHPETLSILKKSLKKIKFNIRKFLLHLYTYTYIFSGNLLVNKLHIYNTSGQNLVTLRSKVVFFSRGFYK